MHERPILPTKQHLTPLRVTKVTLENVSVEALDSGLKFSLPRELLPTQLAEGDRFSLKILDPLTEEAGHTAFAQRLLEEIMN